MREKKGQRHNPEICAEITENQKKTQTAKYHATYALTLLARLTWAPPPSAFSCQLRPLVLGALTLSIYLSISFLLLNLNKFPRLESVGIFFSVRGPNHHLQVSAGIFQPKKNIRRCKIPNNISKKKKKKKNKKKMENDRTENASGKEDGASPSHLFSWHPELASQQKKRRRAMDGLEGRKIFPFLWLQTLYTQKPKSPKDQESILASIYLFGLLSWSCPPAHLLLAFLLRLYRRLLLLLTIPISQSDKKNTATCMCHTANTHQPIYQHQLY